MRQQLQAIATVLSLIKYVFHVALHRRLAYAGRKPVKSVFYVTRSKAAQLVKLHAIMTDHSPLKVEMFEDRK